MSQIAQFGKDPTFEHKHQFQVMDGISSGSIQIYLFGYHDICDGDDSLACEKSYTYIFQLGKAIILLIWKIEIAKGVPFTDWNLPQSDPVKNETMSY